LNYLDWNDKIAARFFRSENAGRRVFLFVTEELIAELAEKPVTDAVDDFIASVTVGPGWVTRSGLCQKALQALYGWRSKSLPFPPYLGFLALFVMAAGIDGDYAAHAYYPRLRRVLGEENSAGPLPSFDRMWELWADLETWTNDDRGGELGNFYFDIAGEWEHVGLPVGQTLLAESERIALPGIFALAELDPAAPLADSALAAALLKHTGNKLRPRTKRTLAEKARSGSQDVSQILLDAIREELSDWDGTVEASTETDIDSRVYGSLRLCCSLDQVAEEANFTVRCKAGRPMPEDGLILTSLDLTRSFECRDDLLGWSEVLRDAQTAQPLDGAQLDWVRGTRLQSQQREWTFSLTASLVRVFVDGAVDQFSGLIEVRQLPRNGPVFLASHARARRDIEAWSGSGCRGFREVAIRTGLPPDWHLYMCESVLNDAGVRKHFPVLQLMDTQRLSFEGGIRSSHGNQYFSFAPPSIRVEGWDDSVQVLCNDRPLDRTNTPGLFSISKRARQEVRLELELRTGGSKVRRRYLYLDRDFRWKYDSPDKNFSDVEGNIPMGGKMAQGSAFDFDYSRLSGLGEAGRILFIGQEPGQVIDWPSEELACWPPVWGIELRRDRGRVCFVGRDLPTSGPSDQCSGDRRRVDSWKEWLWHARKRVEPPSHPSLRKLWKAYQEIARNV
jgi:hypothetical protein